MREEIQGILIVVTIVVLIIGGITTGAYFTTQGHGCETDSDCDEMCLDYCKDRNPDKLVAYDYDCRPWIGFTYCDCWCKVDEWTYLNETEENLI